MIKGLIQNRIASVYNNFIFESNDSITNQSMECRIREVIHSIPDVTNVTINVKQRGDHDVEVFVYLHHKRQPRIFRINLGLGRFTR